MECGIIVARRHDILGDRKDGYLPVCVLRRNHIGPHAFRTPEGKIFIWEDDWKCGCCAPDEDERCYTYGEISEKEFLCILQEQAL